MLEREDTKGIRELAKNVFENPTIFQIFEKV